MGLFLEVGPRGQLRFDGLQLRISAFIKRCVRDVLQENNAEYKVLSSFPVLAQGCPSPTKTYACATR